MKKLEYKIIGLGKVCDSTQLSDDVLKDINFLLQVIRMSLRHDRYNVSFDPSKPHELEFPIMSELEIIKSDKGLEVKCKVDPEYIHPEVFNEKTN